MSDILRPRADRILAEAGLDALVVAAPEAFATVTGASPGPPALFRRAGACLALLPAGGAPLGAVVTGLAASTVATKVPDTRAHPDWIETAGADLNAARGPLARPATFSRARAFGLLGDLLAERGLAGSRIGLDLDFWPAADFAVLCRMLPGPTFVDGSLAFDRIRAVKPPHVAERLAVAAALAEAGVTAALPAIRPGARRADLAAAWSAGVDAEANRRGVPAPPRWEYIAFGPDPWSGGGTLAAGDIVKFDVGTVVGGASSDAARTFSLGKPSPRARDIHAALLDGFEAGREALRPGAPLRAVWQAATAAVRRTIPAWSRGHVGHGLGAGVFGEMWPFLSADADDPVEPGMVLAFETPLYVTGEGGFIIEDQFLITEAGAEPAWSLPHALVEL